MTAATHTPGPWSYDAEQGRVHTPDFRSVAIVCFHAADSLEQEDANGKLLAASPLLLRAAQRALDEMTSPVKAQDPAAWRALIVGDLREAIASASAIPTESPPGA